MDELSLTPYFSELGIGSIRSFSTIGSTNIEAARWANQGAPDLALVAADEQTAGKGRQGRAWVTPPASALAFSLVLRKPFSCDSNFDPAWLVMRLTALGAVAVCEALKQHMALQPQIKWPNDVMLHNRKTAGILAEAQWWGDELKAVILGVGVNITPTSVPSDSAVSYPATCVENAIGHRVDRIKLCRAILEEIIRWREKIHQVEFIQIWDSYLAFKGQWVDLVREDLENGSKTTRVQVTGLAEDGRLKLIDQNGKALTLISGELSFKTPSLMK